MKINFYIEKLEQQVKALFALERHNFMKAFLNEFFDEWNGEK